MFEILRRYTGELTESVLGPIWTWILARSWGTRATILGALLLAGGSAEYPAALTAIYHNAVSVPRAWFGTGVQLPLTSRVTSSLEDIEKRLAESVRGDFPKMGRTVTPWSAAQAV